MPPAVSEACAGVMVTVAGGRMVTVELAVTVVTSVETAVTVTVLPEGTEAGAV